MQMKPVVLSIIVLTSKAPFLVTEHPRLLALLPSGPSPGFMLYRFLVAFIHTTLKRLSSLYAGK